MKKEALEEAAINNYKELYEGEPLTQDVPINAFKQGAKWRHERSYSEEDMISFAHFYFREEFNSTMQTSKSTDKIFKEWFEQFKKK
jgi:hypothetical protein